MPSGVYPRPSVEDRFWSYVEPQANGCSIWTGAKLGGGYGQFCLNINGKRRTIVAHRYAYILAKGPVPDGKCLDHLCRNRACVEVEHLEPVTMRENVLRGIGITARYAKATHCVRGHPFSGDNLRRYKSNGSRSCLTCGRERMRECRKRKKERLGESISD